MPCKGFLYLNDIQKTMIYTNFMSMLNYYTKNFIDYFSILGGDKNSSSLNYRFENSEKINLAYKVANDCINYKSIIMGRFLNSDNKKEKYPIISYNNISVLSFGKIENIDTIKRMYFLDQIKHEINQDELILNCYIYMNYKFGRTLKNIIEFSKHMIGRFSFIIYDVNEKKIFVYVNGIPLYLDYHEGIEISISSDNILKDNYFIKEIFNDVLEFDVENIKLKEYKKTNNDQNIFINPINSIYFYNEFTYERKDIFDYVISSIIEISPNLIVLSGECSLLNKFDKISDYYHIEISKNEKVINLFNIILKCSSGIVFIFNFDNREARLIEELKETIKLLNLDIKVVPIFSDISWSYKKYLENINPKKPEIEKEMNKNNINPNLIYNLLKILKNKCGDLMK